MILASIAAVALGVPVAAVAQQSPSPAERMAILVNQARLAQGLNPVAISTELTAAAVAHTRDMVQFGFMEHEGRDGSTPQQRAIRNGYIVPSSSPWIVVEVISARATAEAASNWLLSDPLHRGVMLRKTWREMGIAYVQGGPYGQLWTIDFGCRPNILPAIVEANGSGGMTLRMTNEECAPSGGSSEQMGHATQVMTSNRPDFDGAVWEPFVSVKPLSGRSGNVFVKLKDGRGRETTTTAGGTAMSTTAIETTPLTVTPMSSVVVQVPTGGRGDVSSTQEVEPTPVPMVSVEAVPVPAIGPATSPADNSTGLFSPTTSILPR